MLAHFKCPLSTYYFLRIQCVLAWEQHLVSATLGTDAHIRSISREPVRAGPKTFFIHCRGRHKPYVWISPSIFCVTEGGSNELCLFIDRLNINFRSPFSSCPNVHFSFCHFSAFATRLFSHRFGWGPRCAQDVQHTRNQIRLSFFLSTGNNSFIFCHHLLRLEPFFYSPTNYCI